MKIITRAEWGARPPDKVVKVPWYKRTAVGIHYSGANKLQTVRSIQDYCMDKRGFSDIDYNFLVDYKGNIYEGRGWNNRGSHILDHNTEVLGFCAIGLDADITKEQMHALRWLYDEANRLAGRTLLKRWHSYYSNTSCPGPRLREWVKDGMIDPIKPLSFPPYPGRVMAKTRIYSANVKVWQRRMKERGWNITVDGFFGPETGRVVRAFQAEKHLKVTGTINNETWNAAWTAPETK